MSSPRRVEHLRQPPHSRDAERSVLGGLMLSEVAFHKLVDWIEEEDFYNKAHRIIWRAIKELTTQGKPSDAVTLGEWFEGNNLAEEVGGTSYIIELANTTPSAANIEAYAAIVKEKSRLRKLIDVGTELTSRAFEPNGSDASAIASNALHQVGAFVADPRAGGLEPIRSGMAEWWSDLQQRYDRGEHLTGLETPFGGLNDLTQGLQPGDTIVIAARPSMGKTVLWENLARHCAAKDEPAALFSLEMRRKAILTRSVAAMTGIPHRKLRRPWELTEENFNDITEATQRLQRMPLYIDDQRDLSAQQIVARARREHMRRPLKFVGIDHLGWLRLPGQDREEQEIGVALKHLGSAAKAHGWVLVILVQLNRKLLGRDDKRPNLGDLRASGKIEEDADVIAFMHREDYYNPGTHLRGVVELIPAKGRDLELGKSIFLENHYSTMRLTDWVGPLPEPPKEPMRFKRKGLTAGKADMFAEQ